MHTALIVPFVTGLAVTPVARPGMPESAWLQRDTTTASKHVIPPLTMDLVRKIAAAHKALGELERAHPDLAKKDSAARAIVDKDTTIGMMVLHFKMSASPPQLAAIKKAGLTPKEFLCGEMHLMVIGTVQTLRNAGVSLSISGGARSGLNVTGLPGEFLESVEADMDFMSRHGAELERLGFKGLGIPQSTPPTPSGAEEY